MGDGQMKNKATKWQKGSVQRRDFYVSKSIYKCLLCGTIYYSNYEEEYIRNVFNSLPNRGSGSHKCSDGNYGRAEYIGHTPYKRAYTEWVAVGDDEKDAVIQCNAKMQIIEDE
jgi:hypothetical protein